MLNDLRIMVTKCESTYQKWNENRKLKIEKISFQSRSRLET